MKKMKPIKGWTRKFAEALAKSCNTSKIVATVSVVEYRLCKEKLVPVEWVVVLRKRGRDETKT